MVDLSEIERVVVYQFCNTDTGEEYQAHIIGGARMALWKKSIASSDDFAAAVNSLNVGVSTPEWMKIHSALSKLGIIGKESQDGKK